MKKILILTIFALLPVLAASSLHAQTHYVNDLMEITVRRGPGLDYRIIKMIKSGHKFEVLGQEKKWTNVRLPDGTTGWVFSQYVTDQKPDSLATEDLRKQVESLNQKVSSLKEENQRLIKRNQELAKSLEKTQNELKGIRKEYKELEDESKDFLKLKEEYEALKKSAKEKDQRIKTLEQRISDAFFSSGFKWFLAGAGVLVLGIILGRTAGSRKKRSSLF
ncbi:MAG: TIGR04211 family SH3 domain-containing protein [Desulfobacteraceae bacterium]|nr:TIGR04211 family SH3 domain-containing protein [Desulfobacteraceae bacterium]